MDQAPRVLNAMIDTAAQLGYLDILLTLMVVSKMIIQVRVKNVSIVLDQEHNREIGKNKEKKGKKRRKRKKRRKIMI